MCESEDRNRQKPIGIAVAREKLAIESITSQQSSLLNDLAVQLEELHSRIDPVLGLAGPEAEAAQVSRPYKGSSSLYATLHEQANQTEILIDRVRAMKQRVEL
jgi:hypothetical protein